MLIRKFTATLILSLALFMVMLSSCQKDPEVMVSVSKVKTDSASTVSGGNILASGGTLTIKFRDSTYTFDASNDSIAFVQVSTSSKAKYFGITAINKAHNVSFGISSAGAVASSVKDNVAGSQLLLKAAVKDSFSQFSLSRLSPDKAFSNLNVVQFNNGKVLAKGTFIVFLSLDNMLTPELYKAEGTFDLRSN